MNLELRDPETLRPHPRNSRLHSDEQITALGRAMLEFGFHQPVVVDEEGTILVGHARTRAAISIGLGKIPVLVAAGFSEAQKRALLIADNRLHEFGSSWDKDLLDSELRELMAGGIDVSLTGFDLTEVFQAQERESPVAEDDVPEVDAKRVVSRLGDVWHLGQHRLAVGDSRDQATVAAALAEVGKPNLMVTDPPYGVEYDPGWRNEVIRANGTRVSARATGKVLNDDIADWREVWARFTGTLAYVWHGALHGAEVERSLEAAGWEVKARIAWDKGRHVIGRGNYHWRHEPCFYATRGKAPKEHWRGGRHQSDLWEFGHTRSQTGHGTQKPVEAMRRPMLNHTAPGEAVFDPFLGSGTSIIAAETSARRATGIELFPLYADVAVRRWEAFTGRHAHHANGLTFEAISGDRLDDR